MDTQTFTEVINTIKRKRKVSPTSVAAFQETADARVTERQLIFAFIGQHPGCSREEITAGTGIKLQSVTGIVTPLVKNNHIKEEGVKMGRCGRSVGRLWPVSEGP